MRWLPGAIFFVGAGWLSAGNALAQDYWLEPGSPLATKGEELTLHLEQGDRLKTDEERPLDKDRVTRFDLYADRAMRRDLLATSQEGQSPVAKVKLESAAGLVVMERASRAVTVDHDVFNRFLAEEGLDTIIAQRAKTGQADANVHESYFRFLKALIQERDQTASTPNTLYKRRVGQRLEILLENDPGRLKTDGKLSVKILFEGKPLPGTRVYACRRGAEGQPPVVMVSTTGPQGFADFKLDQPGLWLIRLVHMRPVAGAKPDAPAQWESFWAAYTFAARNAPPAPAPTPFAMED